MSNIFTVLVVAFLYVFINIYVTKRINKALYLKEERRRLHKKFIWYLPFIGPLIIRGFWKTREDKDLEVMTKSKRKIDKSNYTESGTGMYPV